MHKISITQHKEFKKIKVVPNDNLCINFKENNSRQYKEYENILASPLISGRVQINTLFLRGNNSDYILDEDDVLINGLFKQSKMITIENAGHWLHAEQPEKVLDAMTAFIEKT